MNSPLKDDSSTRDTYIIFHIFKMHNVITKLKSFGNNEIIPLPDAFPYTDGITYSSEHGKYFACRNETGHGTILNSHSKKLGFTGSDCVELRITGCMATSSESTEASAWCVSRATKYTMKGIQQFNTLKLWAALYAISEGIHITENCGIFPIFKYPIPPKDDVNYDTEWKKTSEIVRYVIEMKVDRDKIIAAKEMETKSLIEGVETVKYKIPDDETNDDGSTDETESEDNEDGLTEEQRKIIVGNYTVRNTDGEIRGKQSGCIITSNVPVLRGVDVDGKMIQMTIRRHRAYMCTFKMHERRIHQTQVDHIDGNTSNNVPWNYRWVSRTENNLAKHAERKERVVQDDAELAALAVLHGEPSDPMVWNEGGMTLHSNKWILRSGEPIFIKIAEVGTYPMIRVTIMDSDGTMRSRAIPCHMAIAFKFIERIEISKGALANLKSAAESSSYFSKKYISPSSSFSEFADDLKKFKLHIMHTDNDKSNYSVSNLKIGTPSENQIDRQDNPETTDRKHINLFEIFDNGTVSDVPIPFESHAKAAAHLEVTRSVVSNAAHFNRTCDAKKRRITTHKTTGVKYHVVDAI